MKISKLLSVSLILAGLIISCNKEVIQPEKKPGWIPKRPYVADSNIIEGVGVSDNRPSFKQKRDIAYEDAVDKISMSYQVNDSSYVENYFKSFDEFYSGMGKSKTSREGLQLLWKKNTLKRVTFAEEWEDPSSGRYWVYAFISIGDMEAALLEAAKQQATDFQEYIIDQEKQAFMERIKKMQQDAEQKSNQYKSLVEGQLQKDSQ